MLVSAFALVSTEKVTLTRLTTLLKNGARKACLGSHCPIGRPGSSAAIL